MVVARFIVPYPQRPFKLGHPFCSTEDFWAETNCSVNTGTIQHTYFDAENSLSALFQTIKHVLLSCKNNIHYFSPHNRKLSMLLLAWESYCSPFISLINIAGYDKTKEWIKCPTGFMARISVLTQIKEFLGKDRKAASDTNNWMKTDEQHFLKTFLSTSVVSYLVRCNTSALYYIKYSYFLQCFKHECGF